MKKSMLKCIYFCLVLTAVRARAVEEGLVRVEVRQLQLGVMAVLTVYAPDEQAGRRACALAFDRVRALSAVCSTLDPDSEVSALQARAGVGPVPVSAELFAVLSLAHTLAAQTDGRLDPTVGPLVRLWRRARLDRALPDPAALATAGRLTGYRHMQFDAAAGTVALALPGMRLDLGAFAKGLAGDLALAVLRSNGLHRAMIEAGGDMVFGAAPPGRPGWPVATPHPGLPVLELADTALSVSGDTVQYVEVAGRRYSHVVDPATGIGLTNRLMCVVQAPCGALSDPLATAGTLMPEPAFRALLARHHPTARTWVFPSPEPPATTP